MCGGVSLLVRLSTCNVFKGKKERRRRKNRPSRQKPCATIVVVLIHFPSKVKKTKEGVCDVKAHEYKQNYNSARFFIYLNHISSSNFWGWSPCSKSYN